MRYFLEELKEEERFHAYDFCFRLGSKSQTKSRYPAAFCVCLQSPTSNTNPQEAAERRVHWRLGGQQIHKGRPFYWLQLLIHLWTFLQLLGIFILWKTKDYRKFPEANHRVIFHQHCEQKKHLSLEGQLPSRCL